MVEVDLKGLLGGGVKLVERFGDEAYYVALCIRSGLVRPELPTGWPRCWSPSNATACSPGR